MRILYLSLSYVPSRRASSVQVMKMCAALARRGHEVKLVSKRGEPSLANIADVHGYYCVEPSFELDAIARPKPRGGGLIYAAGMAIRLAKYRHWADVVYCRDPVGALIAAELGMPVVFESHGVPAARWLRSTIARAMSSRSSVGMVAISQILCEDLQEAGMTPKVRPVVVAHDACDPPSRVPQRRRMGERGVVGYVGSLYPGRGIELVVKLAAAMPHLTFQVVGGSESDLAKWRAETSSPNLVWLGFRPQAELPSMYAAMDVVIMPYARSGVVGATGSSDITRWTSPMKMFEYMASGIPIVSSDLPVLREVLLDGVNAMLVEPGDVQAWCNALDGLLADPDLRYRLATAAHDDLVRSYTWDSRAKAVMTGLGLER